MKKEKFIEILLIIFTAFSITTFLVGIAQPENTALNFCTKCSVIFAIISCIFSLILVNNYSINKYFVEQKQLYKGYSFPNNTKDVKVEYNNKTGQYDISYIIDESISTCEGLKKSTAEVDELFKQMGLYVDEYCPMEKNH